MGRNGLSVSRDRAFSAGHGTCDDLYRQSFCAVCDRKKVSEAEGKREIKVKFVQVDGCLQSGNVVLSKKTVIFCFFWQECRPRMDQSVFSLLDR